MKTFKELVNESVKEISLDKVMQKIKDGYWEADNDVEKGKLVSIRYGSGKSRKTMMIRVK